MPLIYRVPNADLHKNSQRGSELWSGSNRRGNKSRISSLMEGKAWVDGGRLAENDPNQSACLWEWNKPVAYLYLQLHHRACFPFSRRRDKRGRDIVTSEGVLHCANCFSDGYAPYIISATCTSWNFRVPSCLQDESQRHWDIKQTSLLSWAWRTETKGSVHLWTFTSCLNTCWVHSLRSLSNIKSLSGVHAQPCTHCEDLPPRALQLLSFPWTHLKCHHGRFL